MACGRSRAHRGIPTTTFQRDDDFQTFCQRQAARAEAISRRIWRGYVDRVLKLSQEGAAAGDCGLEYRRAGHTYGGSPTHRGDLDEER